MYCKECGKQLDTATTFCKYCGSSQTSSNNLALSSVSADYSENIADDNEEELSFEEQVEIIRKHKIFFSNDEVLIDSLGSGFLSRYFVQHEFGKSVIICSNKRVYQQGKLFEKTPQGSITYTHGEKSVDLKNITGLKYSIVSPVNRLIPVVIFFFLGIVAFLLGKGLGRDLSDTLTIFAGFMGSSAIISFIIYSLKKTKWFEIQHAGGSIMTKCNWYPEKNIQQFMRNISLQKAKIIESENNQLSNKI
jgi:RNA polymerase subunit RPABC4/transcription elongation factor Spt4